MINRETGTFKRTYGEDQALYRVPLMRITMTVIFLWVFVGFPIFGSEYWFGVANLIGIACLGALGLNILLGFTGQISIGHAAFMSVGAYTAATLIREFDLPWVLALIGGGLFAALVGMFFGIPSLRIKGLYLAVATLAAQLIIEWVINHWPWLSGGAQGSIYVKQPTVYYGFADGKFLSFKLTENIHYYFLIYIILAIGIIFALNLFRSHLGRSFIAVRDRDIAAEIIGINIFKTKLIAFGIASFYAGVTGVLYTYYYSIANYEMFTLGISIQFLAMVIIGGLGSILGSLLGAVFITMLPITLDYMLRIVGGDMFGWDDAKVSSFLPQWQLMLFGGLIMFFLVVEPDGLNKLWRNVVDYFRVWPFSYI